MQAAGRRMYLDLVPSYASTLSEDAVENGKFLSDLVKFGR